MKPEFFSTSQAADYLSASVPTLLSWRQKGVGPPYLRIERKVKYLKKDLDDWMTKNRVIPGSEVRGE